MVVCKERKKQYMYTAYELNIKSEIELPELISINSRKYNLIDVNICYGKLPQEVRNITNETLIASTEEDNEYVFIKNISRYSIINGDTIIVDPYENADIKMIRSFLFSWVFRVLLKQRDKLNVKNISGIIKEENNNDMVNTTYNNQNLYNNGDSLVVAMNSWGLFIKRKYKGGYIISSGETLVKRF